MRRWWHVGHRGSHRAITRAIASLTVMKLSWKCRSGRERLRDAFHRFSGRGGEMPHTFGDDERVAAKDDGDMVVPTGESSTLVVIESELAL